MEKRYVVMVTMSRSRRTVHYHFDNAREAWKVFYTNARKGKETCFGISEYNPYYSFKVLVNASNGSCWMTLPDNGWSYIWGEVESPRKRKLDRMVFSNADKMLTTDVMNFLNSIK